MLLAACLALPDDDDCTENGVGTPAVCDEVRDGWDEIPGRSSGADKLIKPKAYPGHAMPTRDPF
jgi:hypothetical protein